MTRSFKWYTVTCTAKPKARTKVHASSSPGTEQAHATALTTAAHMPKQVTHQPHFRARASPSHLSCDTRGSAQAPTQQAPAAAADPDPEQAQYTASTQAPGPEPWPTAAEQQPSPWGSRGCRHSTRAAPSCPVHAASSSMFSSDTKGLLHFVLQCAPHMTCNSWILVHCPFQWQEVQAQCCPTNSTSQFQSIFIRGKSCPYESGTPHSLPLSLATTNHPVSTDFALPDCSEKWNHTVCGLWCLAIKAMERVS